MKIENCASCFVQLWRRLEETQDAFEESYRRFCIRRICQVWLRERADEDFLIEVCQLSGLGGYELLPPPAQNPLPSQAFLIALVATCLHIGVNQVKKQALRAAYSEVFPHSRRICVDKKRQQPVWNEMAASRLGVQSKWPCRFIAFGPTTPRRQWQTAR